MAHMFSVLSAVCAQGDKTVCSLLLFMLASNHTTFLVLKIDGCLYGLVLPCVFLQCRQARTDTISPEALQVGSPAFLKDDPTYGQHYYIAALVPLVSEPPQDLAAPTPQLTPHLFPSRVGPRYGRPGKHFACLPSTGPFEGLLLGSLVGRGSFGRVYRGLWKGQVIGVKVRFLPLPSFLHLHPPSLPPSPLAILAHL